MHEIAKMRATKFGLFWKYPSCSSKNFDAIFFNALVNFAPDFILALSICSKPNVSEKKK